MSRVMFYSGYDLLAQCLAGTSKPINGMYVEYCNGTPAEPVITADRERSFYDALAAPYGYARITDISAPTFRSTDATKYLNNKVRFTGLIRAQDCYGPGMVDGVSNFYAVTFVHMPDAADRTQDLIFSADTFKDSEGAFLPITKIANTNIVVQWDVQFAVEGDESE